jgi:hypothetical protein
MDMEVFAIYDTHFINDLILDEELYGAFWDTLASMEGLRSLSIHLRSNISHRNIVGQQTLEFKETLLKPIERMRMVTRLRNGVKVEERRKLDEMRIAAPRELKSIFDGRKDPVWTDVTYYDVRKRRQ